MKGSQFIRAASVVETVLATARSKQEDMLMEIGKMERAQHRADTLKATLAAGAMGEEVAAEGRTENAEINWLTSE